MFQTVSLIFAQITPSTVCTVLAKFGNWHILKTEMQCHLKTRTNQLSYAEIIVLLHVIMSEMQERLKQKVLFGWQGDQWNHAVIPPNIQLISKTICRVYKSIHFQKNYIQTGE